jgi:hypothetical protein
VRLGYVHFLLESQNRLEGRLTSYDLPFLNMQNEFGTRRIDIRLEGVMQDAKAWHGYRKSLTGATWRDRFCDRRSAPKWSGSTFPIHHNQSSRVASLPPNYGRQMQSPAPGATPRGNVISKGGECAMATALGDSETTPWESRQIMSRRSLIRVLLS